jgi:hypothetical protein
MSRWSEIELRLLDEEFADSRTDDLAKALGRSYSQVAQKAAARGLKKSPAYLAGPDAHRLDGIKGVGTRFEKGQEAWNKGVKGVVGVQEACRATQFKKGEKPHTWVPVGSRRVSKDGYLQQKVTDTGYPPKDWRSLHAIVWESANGAIPAGSVVVFKAGRKTIDPAEITVDGLECLTRAELMKRNSYHTNYPPEVARIIQLTGAIKRQINKRARNEQDDQRPA